MKLSHAFTVLVMAAFPAMTLTFPGHAAEKSDPDPVRIGMVSTLFTDIPTPIVNLLTPPFKTLMKEFTGLNGHPMAGGDAYELAKNLVEDKIHLAVFHGVEYAWVTQKYPEFRPLMVAISKHKTLKANLVIRNDNPALTFADIKGKDLAIPFRSREHCRLFIDKNCGISGQCSPKTYFSNITKPAHAEAALDDVLSGKICACVVDNISLDNYEEVKPGCHKRLKVLKESELFPTAVIAYRNGFLSDDTLNKFRTGMMSANKNERGRDLMTMWKISSFDPVPEDYQQTLADILKAYPAPILATSVSRTK